MIKQCWSKYSLTIYNLQSRSLYWLKARKKAEELREDASSKYVESSNELFELSEQKMMELQRQKTFQSEAYIKKMIFEEAIFIYLQRHGKSRRGHLEFIYASLKRMKQYGVHKDLDMYKRILEILPEEKLIPITMWQVEMFHYPRQQEAGVDILCAMEENGVFPDEDLGRKIFRRFGLHTSPMTRYQRMMYWMPKSRNLDPWPKPPSSDPLIDPTKVAKVALERMNLEKETEITMHEISISENETTWIANAQSDIQKRLLKFSCEKSTNKYVYVDGPFITWVRNKPVDYFTLSSEIDHERLESEKKFWKEFEDDTKLIFDSWYSIFDSKTEVYPRHFNSTNSQAMLPGMLTRYESTLDEETVFATCVLGSNSLATLKTWIKVLSETNPQLNEMKIVFRTTNRSSDLVETNKSEENKSL